MRLSDDKRNTSSPGASRKVVDVEKLLHWAYREELPKDGGTTTWLSEMSPMFRLAELGTYIDSWSEDPGFPKALGGPHPDALLINTEVMALTDVRIDWPATRPGLMGNLAALVGDDDSTLRHLVVARVGLVALHARMGTRPALTGEPKPEPIVGANGKPIVQYIDDNGKLVEGRKNRHYGFLARCPLMWFPQPREVAFDRIEYVIWHDALLELASRLSRLDAHWALPPAAPARPWDLHE